jgi:Tfp pilus assembly protein PilW
MLSTARRGRLAMRFAQRQIDAGITLAELMVAMTLSMILGTMTVMFFVSASHLGSRTILTNQNTSDARITLDSWTSMIRVAGWLDLPNKVDRFELITPNKIVFYANLGNRNVSDLTNVQPVTKIALMLNAPSAGADGQLVEIRFAANNTTPLNVRQVSVNATQTGGAWVFTPRDQAGGLIDTSIDGCLAAGTPVAGLCAKAPITPNPGMLDPTLVSGTHTPVSGALRGDGSVDGVLANVGGIDIAFTVADPRHISSTDYASSATVNSGFSDEGGGS